jgi:hypothetical protein
VTTNRADDVPVPPDGGTESLDEQARRKGVRTIQSADDLAQDGVFDTDEELDAFLAHVTEMRHADLV